MPTKNKPSPSPSSQPAPPARKASKKSKLPWTPAGKEMAAIRLESKLTQVAVAEKSGLGQNRSSAIEKSKNLTWDTMNKVAAACRSKSAPRGFGFLALPRDLITMISASAAESGLAVSAWVRRELSLPVGAQKPE